MIDPAKLQSRPGGVKIATGGAITDVVLLEVASEYQKASKQHMTAIRAEELSKRYVGAEKVLQTTKYDGEGVFVYFEAGQNSYEAFAFNAPSGRVRVGLPVLNEFAAHLKKKGVKKGLFRAELYMPGEAGGKRLTVTDVIRTTFQGKEADYEKLHLAMIDCIMVDGRDFRGNYTHFGDTWNALGEYFGDAVSGRFHRMEGTIVPAGEVAAIFESVTSAGGEGLVIRRLNRDGAVKVKPHLTVDCAVVGYVEGDFEGNYGVLSLLTALTYPSEGGTTHYQVFARVGSGFDDAQRVSLLEKLSPLRVGVAPLPMTDSDGRTVQFIKPGLIVELEGDDLLTTGTGDRPNLTQLLSWDGSQWRFARLHHCPRLQFAVFSKLREDKTISSGGARLEQVIPNPELPPPGDVKSGEHEILAREVYTKDESMIRKLIVASRPNETAFPFVVSWTDYSSKRKDPLKVSVAYARNLARANALAATFRDAGVTRGFARVGAGSEAPSEPTDAEKPTPSSKKSKKKAED